MFYIKKCKQEQFCADINVFRILGPREPSRARNGGVNNSRVFNNLSKNPISKAYLGGGKRHLTSDVGGSCIKI